MCINNSHIAMVVGQHDVAPAIQHLAVEYYSPSAFFCFPQYTARSIVKLVLRLGDATEVCQSVIRAITVDVIDLLGLFAVKKKPCEPVSEVCAPLVGDTKVSIAQFKTAGAKSAALDSLDSADDSTFGVIREVIANGIRDNFRNHSVLPHVVARGSVAPTTDTPILTEFASSGGEYRGPKGHPLSDKHRHPFFKERS